MPEGAAIRRLLAAKLGIQERQVNRLVAAKMKAELLDRDLASMAVAVDKNLSITKLAKDEDWTALRLAQGARPNPPAQAQGQASSTIVHSPRAGDARAASPRRRVKPDRTVMVVYGRDTALKDAMFAFLVALDLKPMSWTEGIKHTNIANPSVRQIVDALFAKAVAVVVLLTPDDEVRLKPDFHQPHEPVHETQSTGQARPNVLFEAGMAMSSHPDRTIMTQYGNVKPFTDVGGIHITHLSNSIEARRELATKLINARCQVDMNKDDWRTAGDFEPRGGA
jgi:predicted nucleotide-binding protein